MILRIILLLIIASTAHAEFIQEWDAELKMVESCLPESDVCGTKVTLNFSGNIIALPELVGPIYPAITNNQLLACEYNGIMAAPAAKVFNLSGKLIFKVNHPGYLRECEITTDGKLYWFHYNIVVNSKPLNQIIVFSHSGERVFETTINHGGDITFTSELKKYTIKISEPQWPG